MITTTGYLFVSAEGLIKPYIPGIDSTLLRVKDKVWYKSLMKKGIGPRSGIDTEMPDGVLAVIRIGYLATNFIWYQALVL